MLLYFSKAEKNDERESDRDIDFVSREHASLDMKCVARNGCR